MDSQLLEVPVNANGENSKIVIDTGSSVNIISSEFAKKLSVATKPSTAGILIKGISGSMLSPVGEADVTLQFGASRISQKFLVLPDCPYKLLGGLPFCRAAHLLLDFANTRLQIGTEVFELHVESSTPVHNDVLTTRCRDNVRIEPRTEVVIEVAVSRDGPHLIEPNAKLRNGLQVARTLTNVQCGVGIVRVANPTLSTVTLHRNTKLGWATSIHDAQLGVAVPEGSVGNEELHFETGPHLQPSEQGELTALIQRFRHLFTATCSPAFPPLVHPFSERQ